jgi:hypothetical protein
MATASFPWIKTSAARLGAINSVTFLGQFPGCRSKSPEALSTPRPSAAILQQAIQHADWFNWADAAPEFQQAERLFTYAQWTVQRQERILSLAQDVWDVRFLSNSKKLSVTADSEEDNLVDGMGFECMSSTEDQ